MTVGSRYVGMMANHTMANKAKCCRHAAGRHGDKGDKGDKGNDGLDGIHANDGATGATGNTGSDGIQGEKGNTGSDGIQGEKGNTGSDGIQGEKGNDGLDGIHANDGATGATGNTGSDGIQGEKGNDGATGATGATGAKGEQGNDGATGATGAKGEQADEIVLRQRTNYTYGKKLSSQSSHTFTFSIPPNYENFQMLDMFLKFDVTLNFINVTPEGGRVWLYGTYTLSSPTTELQGAMFGGDWSQYLAIDGNHNAGYKLQEIIKKRDTLTIHDAESYTELNIEIGLWPDGAGFDTQDIEARLESSTAHLVIRDIMAPPAALTTELTIFADFFSELYEIKQAFSALEWQSEDLGFDEVNALSIYNAIQGSAVLPIPIDGINYASYAALNDKLFIVMEEALATLEAYISDRSYEDFIAWESYWESSGSDSDSGEATALSNTIKKGSVPSIVTALRNKRKRPLITRPPNAPH